MTLLVLELHVPEVHSSSELVTGLAALAPSLFSFALSFAVLGTYWVGNAVSLSFYTAVDRAALLLNVLQLFLISLLPFTTAVLGRYPDEAAAVILYGLHLEAIGLAQYAHWVYVGRNPHLTAAADPRAIRRARRRLFIGPVIFAVAMVIALFSPRAGYALYFAALVLYIAIAVRDRAVVR